MTNSARHVGTATKELTLTAYHEAGHAIMAMRHGYSAEYLTIERHGDVLGMFRQRAEWGAESLAPTDENIRRWSVEKCDMLLGGWLAERRYDAGASWPYSMRDLRRMILAIAAQFDSDEEMHSLIRERTAEVSACFNDEWIWACVERLAGQLLIDRTLSGPPLNVVTWRLARQLRGHRYRRPSGVQSEKIDPFASAVREERRGLDIEYGLVAGLCAIMAVIQLFVLTQCSS